MIRALYKSSKTFPRFRSFSLWATFLRTKLMFFQLFNSEDISHCKPLYLPHIVWVYFSPQNRCFCSYFFKNAYHFTFTSLPLPSATCFHIRVFEKINSVRTTFFSIRFFVLLNELDCRFVFLASFIFFNSTLREINVLKRFIGIGMSKKNLCLWGTKGKWRGFNSWSWHKWRDVFLVL